MKSFNAALPAMGLVLTNIQYYGKRENQVSMLLCLQWV